MPLPGVRWRHVVLNTHKSWLPGDPRGFRSFQHKIHSTGDYKAPPPPGEHAGLLRHSKRISGPPVVIPEHCHSVVGKTILRKLKKLRFVCLTIAVSGMHVHLQVELPDDVAKIRHIMGQCKSTASHAIRRVLPGRVWGRDGSYTPIDEVEHQRAVFRYTLDQEGAWTWCYKEAFPDDEEGTEQVEGKRPAGLEDSPRGVAE